MRARSTSSRWRTLPAPGLWLAVLVAPLIAASVGARQGPTLEPLSFDIEVRAQPDEPALRVDAAVTFRTAQGRDEVRFLLRRDIELDEVTDSTGTALAWERQRSSVSIRGVDIEPDAPVTWSFSYRLRMPGSLDDRGSFFTTSPWYPYAATSRPRGDFAVYLPAKARLSIRLPPPWVGVSSGRLNLVEGAGERAFIWTQSRPRSIVPLVIGRFRIDQQRRGNLLGYSFFSAVNAPQARTFVDYTLRVVDYYGREFGSFDQGTYSLVELSLPEQLRGLTQPGLTLLSSDDVAPGSPFPYRILAHEVAHNWWNFLVALPRRTDYWLREGLPTYSALLFLERLYGREMMRQELERTRRIALAPASPRPLVSGFANDDPEALYALNYHKSAFVLHMLRTVMGRDAFVGALNDLVRRHGGGQADAGDFRQLAELRHGEDLGWFFESWVESGLVPSFRVSYSVTARQPAQVPSYELSGVVEQIGARMRGPVLLRVVLQGAPALEHTLWLEPGTTEFSLACPTPPTSLQFDPEHDLLYDAADVVRIDTADALG